MNYTLNVSIPKTLAGMAKEQVKKGYYSSLSEVIREALRRLLLTEADSIPVIKPSKRAERRALKVLEDHKAGRTIKASSFSELARL